MKIQEIVIRNFGKLNDMRITFSEGMNLVTGENESGKTTLHTFIKVMFFGMERGRGRAATNDLFSRYEPWENSNYYSGILKFESGGKTFCIDRNFDRYTKRSSLICEDDGEELSVEDGDLEMVLSGIAQGAYEDTISVGQLSAKPGQALAGELKDFATNYYATGDSDIKLEETFKQLQSRKKELEKRAKEELADIQRKRERIEQEASYVWRDVHKLLQEKETIASELDCRREQERKKREKEQDGKALMDEIRPAKWRIHPVEILLFTVAVICAFVMIAKPWNYLVAIVLSLICGIYVWNRLKVSKKQVKSAPEIILEEITPEEEKIPIEKLEWESARVEEELKEKQIKYQNLQEQLGELDDVSDSYKENDRQKQAVQLAIDKLQELSMEMQIKLEFELNQKASEIISFITEGQYTRILVEDNLEMSLISGSRKIPVEQVSRGTIEQTWFSLRMAASELLQEEQYPVILDDTFVFYDDRRLKRTLEWLSRNRHQVIIFTCQKREEDMLAELGISWKQASFMER